MILKRIKKSQKYNLINIIIRFELWLSVELLWKNLIGFVDCLNYLNS